MSAAKFAPGELVDVTIRGARVISTELEGVLSAEYTVRLPESHGRWRRVSVCMESDSVAVQRVAPPEWPPVAGDIWLDARGAEWHAMVHQNRSGTAVVLREADDAAEWKHAVDVLADHGPMRLDRRRGWTRTEPAPEPEPAEVDERAKFIADMRAFADRMESDPAIPVPHTNTLHLSVYAWAGFDSNEALRAEVDRIAAMFGATGEMYPDREAYVARVPIGFSTYVIYAKLKPEPAEPVVAASDPEPVELAEAPGDAERIAEVEEDAAELASVRADEAAELAAEAAAPTDGSDRCRAFKTGLPGVHHHRCALYLYSTGDHREHDHICGVDGYTWPYPTVAGA